MAKGTVKEEEVKNCPACKKHLNKAKRYYRNSQYFCNKGCWKKVEEEKNKMSAINAVRNKLLYRIVAVVQRKTPYVNVYQAS